MSSLKRLLLVTILALTGGVAVNASAASSKSKKDELVVSHELQSLIQADRAYMNDLRSKQETSDSVEVTQQMVYNKDVADLLFWHSVTAYCVDDPSLVQWTCNSCEQFGPFTVTSVMSDTVNQGYVGYFTQGLPASPIDNGLGTSGVQASDPFVVVSFRGTTGNLKDWIEDLNFAPTPAWSNYPSVMVHSGFLSAYQSLKDDLLVGLAAALNATGARTVLFTGHSLGAAMTEIAAMDLVLNEYPNLNYGVYSQGNPSTPRAGNAAFSQLFTQYIAASFREIHYKDIVPHLPLEIMGYNHVPMEVFFDEAFDSYQVCNSTLSGEDNSCADGLFLPISIDDHTHYRNIEVGEYCETNAMRTKRMAKERAGMTLKKKLQTKKVLV